MSNWINGSNDFLTQACEQGIREHALKEFPNECCGFVVDERYIPLANVCQEPRHSFEISDEDYLENSGKIKCVVHSHTNGKKEPSELDMKTQMEMNIPWVLVSTNGHVIESMEVFGDMVVHKGLEKRKFIHGIYDCYSLIKDYYAIRDGYLLKDYPRQNNWWEVEGGTDDDFYSKKFQETGFVDIGTDVSDLHPGDLCFMRILSEKAINHAGIYVGDGLILHHLIDTLSKTAPIERWVKYIERIVRYDHKSKVARKAKRDLRRVIYI